MLKINKSLAQNGIAKQNQEIIDTYVKSVEKSKNVNFDDMLTENMNALAQPKVIATITVCGALQINVTEGMSWTQPTQEQIQNLHDMLCIDVEMM